ncbi:hypothetical protein HZS_1703 [Henneguya salminicola]|nr:hypothetical protein HZS_1703 [Henneguya salminicola]
MRQGTSLEGSLTEDLYFSVSECNDDAICVDEDLFSENMRDALLNERIFIRQDMVDDNQKKAITWRDEPTFKKIENIFYLKKLFIAKSFVSELNYVSIFIITKNISKIYPLSYSIFLKDNTMEQFMDIFLNARNLSFLNKIYKWKKKRQNIAVKVEFRSNTMDLNHYLKLLCGVSKNTLTCSAENKRICRNPYKDRSSKCTKGKNYQHYLYIQHS